MFPFVISNPVQSLHNKCCIPLNLLELVVAGKNVQFFRKLRLFELEPGGSHLYTQPFGFSTPGNNAAIIVHRYTFYTLKCYEKPF